MNLASDELGADAAAAMRHLIAIRLAWQPGRFDLIALVAGTRGGAASLSFDDLVKIDDLQVSEALAWMSPDAEGTFEEMVSRIEPSWRLALLQAYAQWRHSGLPTGQALIPTKPLSVDPTGHFVPMRFHD